MSLQMAVSRARYSGDPGIFGAITGALGGALKGAVGMLTGGSPLGILTGAVKGGISGAKSGVGTSLSIPVLQSQSTIQRLNATSMPGTGQPTGASVGLRLPNGASIGFGGTPDFGVSAGGVGGAGYYGPGTAMVVRPKAGHLNKSGYWLKNGTYVPPGTKMVTNRRMNPLNPHSLSKSIRRVAGFAHASKSIRTQIGKVATQVAPKRHSCGGKCGTRKR
jgi:hypothetical protein